jgi:hypothetical protein
MADTQSRNGSSGWVAFIAGALIVALIGFFAYSTSTIPQRTAQLDVNVPNVSINPPDVHLPSAPPAPVVPPQASSPS